MKAPRPRRPCVPLRRQASADIYGGSESVTPVTQKAAASMRPPSSPSIPLTSMKVLMKAPKGRGLQASPFVAKLPRTSMKVLKVPRLPRKSSLKCSKCHACHAASRGVHASPFVAKLPQTSMKVAKMSRLPRKSSLRC